MSSILTNSLRDAYLHANTAGYLWAMFSDDEQLINYARSRSSDSLIEEFLGMATTELNNFDAIVEAYAIYVAIMMKNDDAALAFLNGKGGQVKYEWFPELRSIFLARRKPTYISTMLPNKLIDPVIQSSAAHQTISFNGNG